MNNFKIHKKNKVKTGFTTPDHYFENFSIKVMQQLPKDNSKVITIWNKRKTWIYAAAAVIVLSFSIPAMNVLKTNTAEIDSSAENNYITFNTRISQDDLIEHITLEELKDIKINTKIDNEAINDELYDADLENYLINQTL